VNKTQFVYVVYIRTTPEKIWKALIEGEVTRQYWGGFSNVSDWKEGSRWHHEDDTRKTRIVGQVLEVTPPHRLAISWARPEDADQHSQVSRVTFDIEELTDMTRLTVTHVDLEAGSDMEKSITHGWPRVLSSLKSFLETGRPLDIWAQHPNHPEKAQRA
jgi:uncharacterized protein YndB with AHSA1/START domain